MTPVQALELALSKENSAIQLYDNLALKYPEMKELLLFLMNEEEKHRQLIERKISELTLH
jgi:rubrerythrin